MQTVEEEAAARTSPIGLFASLFVEPVKEKAQLPLGRYDRTKLQYVDVATGRPPAVIRCDGSCTVSGSCQATDTQNGSDSDAHDDSDTDNT